MRILVFSLDGCVNCQNMLTRLRRVKDEHPEIIFQEYEITKHMNKAHLYKVTDAPYYAIVDDNNKLILGHLGVCDENEIRHTIATISNDTKIKRIVYEYSENDIISIDDFDELIENLSSKFPSIEIIPSIVHNWVRSKGEESPIKMKTPLVKVISTNDKILGIFESQINENLIRNTILTRFDYEC